MIIDSHCHLDDPDLFNQLDNVINRAEKQQIKYLSQQVFRMERNER